MAANQTSPKLNECGVKITQVRISNFRSLENIEVNLDDLTLLIGANNSGKTSFLDALYAAIGAGRRVLAKEDIHLKQGETDVPKNRKAVIDIRVQPCHEETRTILKSFPAGSYWTGLWGDMITSDDQKYMFVGIRTELVWDITRSEYRIERKFLKQWNPNASWLTAAIHKVTTTQHLEPIALYYMDAQRDIDEDLHTAGSFWRRLISDLGLSEESVAEFEEILTGLNAQIVAKSPVLKHIHQHLVSIDPVANSRQDDIGITPVARHLRDLAKGIDIHFATTDAQSFPLAKHGMGTRSLASILVFRAYASWRASQSSDTKVHTFLALEEPEAHLHPQAQRSLFSQIKKIPGQRIISTHSPYFAGQARLEDLRLFQKSGSQSRVSSLDLTVLEQKNRRQLEQHIIQTRGDILFCRALILFEGQTEEVALPIFAHTYWGMNIHELGFNFVSVGGKDFYFPFVWLAKNLEIKWYIFSDGEDRAKSSVEKTIKKLADNENKRDNVFVLPDGNNFESYLIAQDYLPEIQNSLLEINKNHAHQHGATILDVMEKNKTDLAGPLATAITTTSDPNRQFPPMIAALFEKISSDFGIPKAGDTP